MKTKEKVSELMRYINDNAKENVEYICTDYDSGDGYMLPPMANYEPSYSYEFEDDVKVFNGAPLHRELAEEIEEQVAYCNNINFNF